MGEGESFSHDFCFTSVTLLTRLYKMKGEDG